MPKIIVLDPTSAPESKRTKRPKHKIGHEEIKREYERMVENYHARIPAKRRLRRLLESPFYPVAVEQGIITSIEIAEKEVFNTPDVDGYNPEVNTRLTPLERSPEDNYERPPSHTKDADNPALVKAFRPKDEGVIEFNKAKPDRYLDLTDLPESGDIDPLNITGLVGHQVDIEKLDPYKKLRMYGQFPEEDTITGHSMFVPDKVLADPHAYAPKPKKARKGKVTLTWEDVKTLPQARKFAKQHGITIPKRIEGMPKEAIMAYIGKEYKFKQSQTHEETALDKAIRERKESEDNQKTVVFGISRETALEMRRISG